jgi:vacuolar-type H+-ATPase subunit I/STV1
MIDVHAPHESMHSWRDFLLHLVTITIGLLIALSLEGLVEWQHHRHLVHEAEASLHAEIKSNADGMSSTLTALHKNQAQLKNDVDVLKVVIATNHLPHHSFLAINFGIVTFDDVSWKTAQSTDALSYMPYDMAKEYASIYVTQDELLASEQQAARDATVSLGPFLDMKDSDPDPTPEQAQAIKQNIETLQGQLLLVDSILQSLDQQYKKFLTAHPN